MRDNFATGENKIREKKCGSKEDAEISMNGERKRQGNRKDKRNWKNISTQNQEKEELEILRHIMGFEKLKPHCVQ